MVGLDVAEVAMKPMKPMAAAMKASMAVALLPWESQEVRHRDYAAATV